MLSEILRISDADTAVVWQTVMPGVEVCSFSMDQKESGLPIALSVQMRPMQFETFFCCGGILRMERKQGGPLAVGKQELLLMSDGSAFRSARIEEPLKGILVAVNGEYARETAENMCRFLGDLKRYANSIREQMEKRQGYMVIRSNPWNRNVFSAVETLSQEERGKYCALKTLEMLYLLCTRSEFLKEGAAADQPDSYLTRTVTAMQEYMENHLDEKLTIETMSRRFHISATTFKSCFRRLNGQPVHRWLQQQRLRQAGELLRATPMTVLQVAQAVGYEGISQFNVAFKRQYGITPGQYRKMSNSVDF